MRPERRGFTVLELIVALTLTALVVSGARGMLVALQDGADLAASASVAADLQRNSTGLLRDLLARTESGGRSGTGFEGGPTGLSFDTWCDSADGELVRCRAVLAIVSLGSPRRSGLSLTLDASPPIDLRLGGEPDAFAFQERTVDGATWLPEWGRSLRTPTAIGVVMHEDTTFFLVGIDR